jgi:5S rRNA maturation endonuclease (ribonuclease M5)
MTSAEEIARSLGGRKAGDGWLVKCVSHDDAHASLSITTRDGKLLWKCQAGCSQDSVRDGLIGKGFDLKGETKDTYIQPSAKRRQVSEKKYRLPLPDGSLVEHLRIDYEDGTKSFAWFKDGKLGLSGFPVADVPLYGSIRPGSDPVLVTEGEKAAEAIASLGFCALGTVCGSSSTPTRSVLSVLSGRDVYLWPDFDETGKNHMDRIAKELKGMARSIHIITWGKKKGDDAYDLAQSGGCQSLVCRLMGDSLRVFGPRVLRRLSDATREAEANLSMHETGQWPDRIPTGISKLDEKMSGGMRPGRLVLLGAPTGSGKTTLAQQISSHCAATRGPVLFVSPEMDLEELTEREIIRRSGTSTYKREKSMSEDVRADARIRHTDAARSVRSEALPVYVLDESATMDDVEETAREIKGLRLIVIDYAQEVADDSDPRTPRYLAVGDVARRGVQLARRLHIPVLVCSQVNTIKGKDGEIEGYAFRESAVLQHKAAVVWILSAKWVPSDDGTKHLASASIICEKYRGGQMFELPIRYEPSTFSVTDIQEERDYE